MELVTCIVYIILIILLVYLFIYAVHNCKSIDWMYFFLFFPHPSTDYIVIQTDES